MNCDSRERNGEHLVEREIRTEEHKSEVVRPERAPDTLQ